jgi:hypothetical protein
VKIALALVAAIEFMQLTAAAAAVSFDTLVKHPEAYHSHRVTVVGVAAGDGPTFEIHPNAKSVEDVGDAAGTVLARASIPWDYTRHYRMRLVRVTGIVDAHHHGLWGNACEISVEKIQALTVEPLVPWKVPVAVIRNAASSPYHIHAGPAGMESQLVIAPHGILELPRPDGTLTVLGVHEEVLSRQKLDMSGRSRYLDRKEGAFYYEIRDGRITQVLPKDAKAWGWRR